MSPRSDGDRRPYRGHLSVGLDVGGTKILGVLLDAEARVLGSVRLPTVTGAAGVIDTAARAVEQLVHAAGVRVSALAAVGVGIPGVVDPRTGRIEHAVNVGIHESVALGPHLAERLGGVLVHVDNDLNAAALGAAHLLDSGTGAGTGTNPRPADLAFLSLGTGLAAGLVLDGAVRRGANGTAGEIGHIPLVADGLPCACGQRGCLERYASGSALDAAWPSRTGRPAPAELFEAAAAGDPDAVRIRDEFASAVASAVRLLVLTCDVARVVIGGGVSAVGTPLLEAVRAALVDQTTGSDFLRSMDLAHRIELAPVGVPVAAIGAALLGAAAPARR
ncbi:ROK family protein [Pengzhenrongella frigida]|uniref:ROK family protein n=1 Tax=Pengzhenrongella frigida TaxID=1259133 RepID=A0A4Q5MW85_9MICO|nr:ROK family protein [Cellulomonas sp. HLT2-17]RYV49805.1 ROK family protein [Cellulomonas sp. HLT2-17]